MDLAILSGDAPLLAGAAPAVTVVRAEGRTLAEYRALRREVFVEEQSLFDGSDADDVDDDPRGLALVALDQLGEVLGGVRLAPVGDGPDLGWWTGSRLVVRRGARGAAGLGGTLVRAACAEAEAHGVIRFEADVQTRNETLFRRLGWVRVGASTVRGVAHARMRWPIDRFDRAAKAAKSALGGLLQPLVRAENGLGGRGFVGDDGAPVPGSDLVAVCDAIVPSMIERHPEWAGWCSVLVNVNDLTAMGATATGLLDAVGARDASFASRIIRGIADAAEAWGVPVLGGHTQLGVPSALSVTGLGRAERPVRGAARAGLDLSLTVDVSGGWRPGFGGAQWDSTSHRRADDLRRLAGTVRSAAPEAAKDVSMAGIVGTVGMLAEAGGSGAVIDVTAVPRPDAAGMADWLSCFPGFGMLTADLPGRSRMADAAARTAVIGRHVTEPGVRLLWPDGVETEVVHGAVTGLGRAG